MNTTKTENTNPKRQTEPTCTSCNHLSVRGHYCHNWQRQARLTGTCSQHSSLKDSARG